jgi:hypothetical protein
LGSGSSGAENAFQNYIPAKANRPFRRHPFRSPSPACCREKSFHSNAQTFAPRPELAGSGQAASASRARESGHQSSRESNRCNHQIPVKAALLERRLIHSSGAGPWTRYAGRRGGTIRLLEAHLKRQASPGPARGSPTFEIRRNVPVRVRDGTVLRVNVSPANTPGPFPVIMSAHPFGKERIPEKTWSGHSPNLQARLVPQPRRMTIPALTS